MRHADPASIPRRPLVRSLAASVAVLILGLPAAPAMAAPSKASPAEPYAASAGERPARGVRRHRIARPAVQRTSSDETAAERDRRLARECRGLPNAGACLGYAR